MFNITHCFSCRMVIFLWGVSILLIGCTTSAQLPTNNAVLPYKVAGASDPDVGVMQERLQAHGIRVITQGQNYLVSIPSAVLFANQSPRLTWAAYGALNDVACFLKQFRKTDMNVLAYSNKCKSPERDKALTRSRARSVANYLWSQNIDSRFIFTHGLGSDKPIMAYNAGGDASLNSRIEITFRDAVA